MARPSPPGPLSQVERGSRTKKDTAPSWTAAFDEPTARVFLHLERHGSITEEELNWLLGGPRPARGSRGTSTDTWSGFRSGCGSRWWVASSDTSGGIDAWLGAPGVPW